MIFFTAQIAFYYLAFGSVTSAILAVTRKNPVHSMLWVLALFLHIAGLFLLLRAEFLAAVQVIVYAGAILIFYLFVLMLLDLSGEGTQSKYGRHWPFAILGSLGFGALAWLSLVETFDPVENSSPQVVVENRLSSLEQGSSLGSLSETGLALFGPFALPFEIASLILLAAIVSAVILAKRRTE